MSTNQGYVQTRCPRCGAGAWALPTYAVPCQSCGTPVGPIDAAAAAGGYQAAPANGYQAPANGGYQAPANGYQAPANGGYQAPANGGYQAQPANGGYQAPQAYGAGAPAYQGAAAPMPAAAPAAPAAGGHNFAVNVGGFKIPFKLGGAGGGVSRFKIFGAVALAIVLGIGGVIFKMKFGTTAKGNLSYSSLGVDRNKPDADKLMNALATPAKKWKRDAIWYSVNYQAVDAEGRVDVSKGAEVVYISEGGVQSASKSVRKDTIKKYNPGPAGVSQRGRWDATNQWEVEQHPVPKCTIKDVMAIVGPTLAKGKTVRVTFDPKFADYYAWRVMSDNPKLDTLYGFEDCAVITK